MKAHTTNILTYTWDNLHITVKIISKAKRLVSPHKYIQALFSLEWYKSFTTPGLNKYHKLNKWAKVIYYSVYTLKDGKFISEIFLNFGSLFWFGCWLSSYSSHVKSLSSTNWALGSCWKLKEEGSTWTVLEQHSGTSAPPLAPSVSWSHEVSGFVPPWAPQLEFQTCHRLKSNGAS